jgi:8-oxo-dGTP diphosphatase
MIDVTCAVIRNEDDEILVVQRGEKTDHPFKWEFPGGKVKPGETEEECILREIKEELSIDMVICSRLPAVEHDYGHKQVKLIPFVCDTLHDLPFLTEHIAFRWADAGELIEIDFSEADIFVAEAYLHSLGGHECPEKPEPDSFEDSIDEGQVENMVSSIMGTREAEWMASSAVDNPALFRKMLEYSMSGDRKLAFRASWILSKACDIKPCIVYPYLSGIIELLGKTDNESVLRSFLRIISLSDHGRISPTDHGRLAEFSFRSLNSGNSAIAIKAYSMEILYRLTLIYPEFAAELAGSIMRMMEEGSGGIVSRGKMILKKLNQ